MNEEELDYFLDVPITPETLASGELYDRLDPNRI